MNYRWTPAPTPSKVLAVGSQTVGLDFVARSIRSCPPRLLLAIRSPSILGQDADLFPQVARKVKRSGPRGYPITPRRRFIMGRKLYVGNMSYEVDSSELQTL